MAHLDKTFFFFFFWKQRDICSGIFFILGSLFAMTHFFDG